MNDAFSYDRVHGLYFLAVVFVAAILRIISALRLVIQYQAFNTTQNVTPQQKTSMPWFDITYLNLYILLSFPLPQLF